MADTDLTPPCRPVPDRTGAIVTRGLPATPADASIETASEIVAVTESGGAIVPVEERPATLVVTD